MGFQSLSRMLQIPGIGAPDGIVFTTPDTGNFAQGLIGSQS
jgi:hypothetical protein